MDTFAAEVSTDLSRVRSVNANSHLGRKTMGLAVVRQTSLDRDGTTNRSLGTLKTDEKTVTGAGDFLSVVRHEQGPHSLVVPTQQSSPCFVTEHFD